MRIVCWYTRVYNACVRKSSKVTDKYQVTLPSFVRDIIGLSPSDRVTFTVTKNNEIRLEKVLSLDEVMGSIKTDKNFDVEEMTKTAQKYVAKKHKQKWEHQ